MLPMSIVATECMSGLRNADVCATQPCQLRAHSQERGVLFGRFRLFLVFTLHYVAVFMIGYVYIIPV